MLTSYFGEQFNGSVVLLRNSTSSHIALIEQPAFFLLRPGVVGVSPPSRPVPCIRLISPGRPALSGSPAKKLQIWPRRTSFDDFVLLIGFARMLALAGLDHVDLAAAWRQRPRILALDTKQQDLRYVSKIEADTATIGSTVFTYFMPDYV